jgi:ABC-type transporter Mla subunit MlaD
MNENQETIIKLNESTTAIFEEVKLAQNQLIQNIAETTELLSEKTYLYKLEDELKVKEKDLNDKIAKYDRDKETISKQISNFSILLDKTANNLTLNEMTTEMLGNAVTHFNSQVKNITSISDTMNDQIKNIHQEREEYQRIGNLITDQLDEINKQSDGMMKLNVLSTYIHQTIKELRDAESSLKLLIETSQSNTKENKEATANINNFLKSAGKLFDATQQQIESSVLSNKNLQNIRNELVDTEFQLKQKTLDLEKIDVTLEKKQKKLTELDRSILDKSMENKFASKNDKK